MSKKLSEGQRSLIGKELRRGTSKSRIASLLDVDYETGLKMIEEVKESVRPDIGDKITFQFRGSDMAGIITKLLANSAVVDIYWQESDAMMQDIIEDKTIVNYKDIIDFISLPPQEEDKEIILNPQPTISNEIDSQDKN
ncbi:DUF2187 family protein [Facklamia sp. DSM 111018]|uniref:DUF2187 family protein n=1 Tax=Facklamia lactis TaxID=2749967 RepID=A0ABS0LP63_9LACT|nr:DUF2187 family protein [Facklamia lactis]MBG9980151.1 DUF2187 family protein [Facklamia lactis]MBG9985953.1 DUF2187 family protein [Facklamia lactis]